MSSFKASSDVELLCCIGVMPRPSIPLPSVETIEELLNYDSETGILTWKETKRNRKKGERAGCVDNLGYRVLSCGSNRNFKAHRLIWKLMTGEDPKGTIDHINGDRDDNRWENLREADMSQQNFNKKSRGYNKRGNAYQVVVRAYGEIRRKTVHTEEDAIKTRDEFRKELWGEYISK